MRPASITASLAETHRQDLLREAQRAALAAEADPITSGLGTAALLLTSDLLLAAGHRLRARIAQPPLVLAYAHTSAQHKPACVPVSTCRRTLSSRPASPA